MPDLFAHALTGYVLATLLSWRYEAVTPPFVTLAMVGAVSPDLNRIDLVVPEATVEALFGIPWSWRPLHRLGGTLLVVAVGAVLVDRRYRRLAVALVAVGAASHYVLDALLYTPSGLSTRLLWPFTGYRVAVDGLYVSSDRWPAAVALVASLVVWGLDRRHSSGSGSAPTGSDA